jgi:putative endopeptidase
MFAHRTLFAGLLLTASAFAQSSQLNVSSEYAAGAAASASSPVARPKSFDLDALDKTVDPCVDFFQYACGTWRKNNPIPGDQARWGRFNELAEYNRQVLRDILEKASSNDSKRNPITKMVGDFYSSCMDEGGAEKKAATPIQLDLDGISAIKDQAGIMPTVAHLHSEGIPALFTLRVQPDLHNAGLEIAHIAQGGLGLPDRDYYLTDDAKSKETREKYVAHMERMFALLGDDEAKAKQEAAAVMAIESKLADASFERVKMRDPKNRDHKMKVSEFASLAANFDLRRYLASTGAPAFDEVNVVPPDFFQKTNGVITSVPLAAWKSYLRWHVVRTAAPLLSKAFVDENFDFFGRFLNGQKEQQVRWKRCTQLTDNLLGEALGQPYVSQTFGPDSKKRMLTMVDALEKALASDIADLPWMTAETKKQAAIKLKAISNKIGYPDKWRDYSSVKITRDDLAGNAERARAFEVQRNLNKIGRPLDKTEWTMTPPTVNAYYNPSENDINFPAGILQPPFFDFNTDDAVNFGGIGVVIGHELTHGFDDQGSKFDADGNLTNWWTSADREEFDKRTSCVADQYGSFTVADDLHLNGRLTLGENTADNGGLRVSLMALHSLQGSAREGQADSSGFTPEQKFFLGFAQVWCESRTPENERLMVKIDPHSPGRYRVQGTVQNSPDFAKAFGCKAGQPMVKENACRVW